MTAPKRPITLALAALGGQGGGVVAGWLAAVARAESYIVQATSVPGVAQRTGATLYYLEFYAESDLPPGRRPVLALMPSPGDVDIVVATELVEAGRAIQRGLVTPERTTLVTSTHRAYTISEKAFLGDGRADPAVLLAEAERSARRLATLDMAAIADRHGTVISSVILGAIAGAAGLPFAPDSYRRAIREGGIAVETNLAAFDAGFEESRRSAAVPHQPAAVAQVPRPLPGALAARIAAEFPLPSRPTLEHGVRRLVDYQDASYAGAYLDRMSAIASLERPGQDDPRLTTAVAKGLALWMSFEDTIRVAELKTRPDRLTAIRKHVRAKAGQVVQVREFLKPRVEELCGTLPAAIGRRLLASPAWRRRLTRLTGARQVRTTTIGGFVLLRAVASLKRYRRGTLRFQVEQAEIDLWLATVDAAARHDYELAVELADNQRLVRGYGDTYERGLANFRRISAVAERLAGRPEAAPAVARLRRAALADEQGTALAREFAALGLDGASGAAGGGKGT